MTDDAPGKERHHRSRDERPQVLPALSMITASRYVISDRYSWPRHRHGEYELIVVLSGLYSCRINDIPVTVHPGHAVLVVAGDWHEDHCPAPVTFASIEFSIEARVGRRLFSAEATPRRRCVAIDGPRFAAVHQALMTVSADDSPFMQQEQDGLVQACFWQYLAALPAGHLGPDAAASVREDRFPRRFLRLLDAHLHHACDVSRLAAELGMSKRRLEECCRAAFGESPARMLRQRRFERARDLLQRSDAPVGAIAAAFGFADAAQFTRGYRSCFGCTPTADRRAG